MKPRRIQRKRTRGWKMPLNAVYVGRPSKFGNPFRVGISWCDHAGWWHDTPRDNAHAVELHREWIQQPERAALRKKIKDELRGKDLVCWCSLEQPCHADTLLELANQEE